MFSLSKISGSSFQSSIQYTASTLMLLVGLSMGLSSVLSLTGCAAKAPTDPIGSLPAHVAEQGGEEAVYDYSSIVMPELWILTKFPLDEHDQMDRNVEEATLPWIQLDGIRYPFVAMRNKRGYRETIAPLSSLLNETLRDYESFRFVRSSWGMAGPRQVGGVIYLDDHLTLQDMLLRRGLACVDQRRINSPLLEATFNPELVEFWLKSESEARRKKRGFWKTHPKEMEAISQPYVAPGAADEAAVTDAVNAADAAVAGAAEETAGGEVSAE